jgi:NAD(P)-dependent dehydrogenase (short-subunit alcohol dehydrogenase family)
MTRRLEGRVAAVIGGGSGMGRAISRRFGEEGANVYVADLSLSAAEAVAGEITESGASAVGVQVDAVSNASLSDLYARIDSEHGKLHVLHNQVGMPGPGGLDVSEADFARNIDVNVKTAFYGANLAYPLLKKADGKASVIFLASSAALIGSQFSPLYSLTKGAIVAFARSFALAAAADGIRANVICPGPVDTPMLSQFFGRERGANIEDLMSAFIALLPLQRPATVEEIAGVAAFLASDDAGFVTGVALPVDGGQTAK